MKTVALTLIMGFALTGGYAEAKEDCAFKSQTSMFKQSNPTRTQSNARAKAPAARAQKDSKAATAR